MKALKRCFICCALLLSLVLISCGGNETSSDSLDNSDKVEEIGPTQNHDEKKRYIVDLNLSNFRDYFDFTDSNIVSSPCYIFRGCLDYAYYYNCVVTINHDGKIEKFKLNTAGNSDLPTYYRNTELVSITGQVIFWM